MSRHGRERPWLWGSGDCWQVVCQITPAVGAWACTLPPVACTRLLIARNASVLSACSDPVTASVYAQPLCVYLVVAMWVALWVVPVVVLAS